MISKKVLKEAAENTHEILLHILPESEAIDHEFSEDFEKRIKEIKDMIDKKTGKAKDE